MMSSLALTGDLEHTAAAASLRTASVAFFAPNGGLPGVPVSPISPLTLDGSGLQCPPDILPPTSDEWESKKDIIEELYIRKRLKLNEVKHRMETLHGFKAK